MRSACPAAKVCPLRCEHCGEPDDLCVMLLGSLTRCAEENAWPQERCLDLEKANALLRDALVAELAEKSVTPQHELITRMLEDTKHYGIGEMTAQEVHDWMRKVKLI